MATQNQTELFTEATLAHCVNLVLKDGMTAEELKSAKRSWTRAEVREAAVRVCTKEFAPLVDAVTDRVWDHLGRVDANRAAIDPGLPMYRRLSGEG